MGAFGWSPGGCCCDPNSFWFDVYRFDDRTPKHLERVGTVAVAGPPAQTSSFTDDEWYVTPSAAVQVGNAANSSFTRGQIYGYGTQTELLWSAETRNAQYHIARYDCKNKSELFSHFISMVQDRSPFPAVSNVPTSGVRLMRSFHSSISAGSTELGIVTANVITPPFGGPILVDANMSVVSAAGVINYSHVVDYSLPTVVVVVNVHSYTETETPCILAPRSWPKVAITFDRVHSAQISGIPLSGEFQTKFIVGDLRVENGKWRVEPDSTITFNEAWTKPPNTAGFNLGMKPTWHWFDASGDSWIGVIQWSTYGGTPAGGTEVIHQALVHNGQIIEQNDGVSASSTHLTTRWQSPHATESGECLITTVNEGLHSLRCYKGGSLQWELSTPDRATVMHSSDRWVYVNTGAKAFNQMPPSLWSSSSETRTHWLIKKDFSGCAPFGVRQVNPATPPPQIVGTWPLAAPNFFIEIIHHSGDLVDVPPAEIF